METYSESKKGERKGASKLPDIDLPENSMTKQKLVCLKEHSDLFCL